MDPLTLLVTFMITGLFLAMLLAGGLLLVVGMIFTVDRVKRRRD